jgi:predicted transcriptional regulator
MTPKLTDELRHALQQHPGEPLPIKDDQTQTVYVIVDQAIHERAMQALQRQEDDVPAIQVGLNAAAAGQVSTLDEADQRIRERVGFPPRQ